MAFISAFQAEDRGSIPLTRSRSAANSGAFFKFMKYLFFVQSEGRGHLSQALAVAAGLRHHGHEICGVVTNYLPTRPIPEYFIKEINAPLYSVDSPYFLITKDQKGIAFGRSLVFNFSRLRAYWRSLKKIKNLIKTLEPDIVINFYESLFGFYRLLFRPPVKSFTIGHQFFITNPDFIRPPKNHYSFLLLKFYNRLVSYGSTAKIALSFSDSPDQPQKKVLVCPPLIRQSILDQEIKTDNFILSYILNPGYAEIITDFATKNKEIRIEAFWDKLEAAPKEQPLENLCFHKINGDLFIDRLSKCGAYIATAGFESICEAAYLEKPILMIPTPNHYEQQCNAYDAKRCGLAEFSAEFDFDKLLALTKTQVSEPGQCFKKWHDENKDKIFTILENRWYQK